MWMNRATQAAILVCLCLLLLPAKAPAQVSAAATVPITATLHGNISINTRLVPVSIPFESGTSAGNRALVPLEFTWNLNPREVQGFEVIGYFADPNAALAGDSTSSVVPSAYVLGRWESGAPRSFTETHELGPASASLSLFSESVLHGHSRGTRNGVLELTIDPQLASTLRTDDYRGVLYVEVRHY
jgi:hypothetical protein